MKIARDLATELGEADIVPIAKAVKERSCGVSGRVGIVFPVYAFSVPLIVSDFIKKLRASKSTYFFAIATCASVAAGVLNQLSRQLDRQGLKLFAGFVIKMPNNYTPFGGAIMPENQEELFAKEVAHVKKIVSAVKEARECGIEASPVLWRLAGAIISPMARRVMRREDKNFWTTSACTGCGICAKVCPVANVKIVDRKPAWMHACEQCFACLHWCPEEAIQYQKSTLGRTRYRNPYVTLQDFIKT